MANNSEYAQGDLEMEVEYPHAASNSEFAYLDECAAQNAIDGNPETAWRPVFRRDFA